MELAGCRTASPRLPQTGAPAPRSSLLTLPTVSCSTTFRPITLCVFTSRQIVMVLLWFQHSRHAQVVHGIPN